jgi:hypothetical protein
MVISRSINAENLQLFSGGAQHRDGARPQKISRRCAPPSERAGRLRTVAVAFALAIALSTLAHGGTLTTLDGQTFEGSISFAPDDALIVAIHNGASQRVELSNTLRATLVPENRPLLRGILLTSGEAIAANAITRLDSTGVRIVRPAGIAVVVSASDLAAVFFRPVSAEMFKRIPPGHAGAILDNGDFFEGDPVDFNGNQVKISSVLFGIQSFDVTRQARAIVLQDAAAPDADEMVRLVDGSVLLGKSASVSEGRLTIDDARLGTLTVEARTVAQISLGGDAFDRLTGLAPSKVEGDPIGYATDSTTAGVPMTMLGVTPIHGIGQRPGIRLTWNIGGKYESLIARAGVPLALVPIQRLQFVVLADGKEVFRSPPRSSIDDPASVAVSLKDVKTLTLRVEGAEVLAPGAAGLWADPILVRDGR